MKAPRNTPTRQNRTFCGCSATRSPLAKPATMSMVQNPRRARNGRSSAPMNSPHDARYDQAQGTLAEPWQASVGNARHDDGQEHRRSQPQPLGRQRKDDKRGPDGDKRDPVGIVRPAPILQIGDDDPQRNDGEDEARQHRKRAGPQPSRRPCSRFDAADDEHEAERQQADAARHADPRAARRRPGLRRALRRRPQPSPRQASWRDPAGADGPSCLPHLHRAACGAEALHKSGARDRRQLAEGARDLRSRVLIEAGRELRANPLDVRRRVQRDDELKAVARAIAFVEVAQAQA